MGWRTAAAVGKAQMAQAAPLQAIRLEAGRRQLEAGEVEARRHRAADQRPGTEAFRLLPGVRRHDRLRLLPGGKLAPSRTSRRCPFSTMPSSERRAGVPVPHLGRIDPVPARDLACPQQEVDGGGGRAVRCASASGVAERLAIMPAFWMRLEAEQSGSCRLRSCRSDGYSVPMGWPECVQSEGHQRAAAVRLPLPLLLRRRDLAAGEAVLRRGSGSSMSPS